MNSSQWNELCNDINDIYNDLLSEKGGESASYIPQLAKVNPDLFGISIYSIDNKYFGVGNTEDEFCIQSCSKTLTYAVALRDNGVETINKHIGREPSGARFNAFVFDDDNKPFNPLINSGAIMSASLVKNNCNDDERFEYMIDTWKSIVGKENVGFDNAVYLSEKNTANRNRALAYLMMENEVFPKDTNIEKTLEFYFQLCSIKMNSKALSKYAAMLSNGGITIDTNEKIFNPGIVRDLLCIMYSAGMYDYSGRWSFDIGLPAKSGVSGAIFAVVPHIGGICVYSPRLDNLGNSVRGVEFFKRLTEKYKLHIFDTLITGLDQKKTLLRYNNQELSKIYEACQENNIVLLEKLLQTTGININEGDYDQRRPLHIAVDEKNYSAIYILLRFGANYKLKDRWGNSMHTEAILKKNKKLASLILMTKLLQSRRYVAFSRMKKILSIE